MCGVVALRSYGPPLPEGVLDGALGALRHRGPDALGAHRAAEGRVWLGHTRLSIVAPDDGAQPILSESGRVVAVVNGELYGHEGLRRDLRARGHHFRTQSDSEILVHLYEEYGLAFVQRLRGEFAFVLWDEAAQRLVAGRDRFGIKPLVYAEHGARLALASEAKALFQLGLAPSWDRPALEHAFTHQYLPPERTFFAGVWQVPAGCLLIAEGDTSPRLERYWDLDVPALEVSTADDDAPRRLREALDEAVRLRLGADVPVAFHLSGGLDSASILALAARHTRAPLHAFAVGFRHAPYGEGALAEEIAAALGAELHLVDVDQDALVDALSDAVFFSEGLCINGQLPAKLLLARAIQAQGFKVVLSGEGADEALLGYAHLGRDQLLSEREALTPEDRARLDALDPAQLGVMLPDGDGTDLSCVRDALGFVPTFLEAKGALGAKLGSLFSDDVSAEVVRREAFARLWASSHVTGQLRGRPRVLQAAALWTRLALAGYILRTLGDGTEMAASVEGRTPFLDHVFFEHVRALPTGLKIRDGVSKFVLREAMRGLLPKAVTTRRKHPFLAPPITRFCSARAREFVLDRLVGSSISRVPLLDSIKVRRFAERVLRGDEADALSAEPVLMTILSACLLQERFQMRSRGQ